MKYLIILLMIFIVACEGKDSGDAEVIPPVIDDPVIDPPIEINCNNPIDDTCIDIEYVYEMDEAGCQAIKDWNNSDVMYYFIDELPAINFSYRLDSDGFIQYNGQPGEGSTFYESDKNITIGDCSFHLVDSLSGADYVEYNGIEL